MSDKHIYIKSYGCQMNVYDSNRIKDLFSNKGYKICLLYTSDAADD